MTGRRIRLIAVAGLLSISVGVAAQTPSGAVYRLALKPPEFLEPFAPKLEPGHDAFTAEPIAAAIERNCGPSARPGGDGPEPPWTRCWRRTRGARRCSRTSPSRAAR